jgi:hypothetical protein
MARIDSIDNGTSLCAVKNKFFPQNQIEMHAKWRIGAGSARDYLTAGTPGSQAAQFSIIVLPTVEPTKKTF